MSCLNRTHVFTLQEPLQVLPYNDQKREKLHPVLVFEESVRATKTTIPAIEFQ